MGFADRLRDVHLGIISIGLPLTLCAIFGGFVSGYVIALSFYLFVPNVYFGLGWFLSGLIFLFLPLFSWTLNRTRKSRDRTMAYLSVVAVTAVTTCIFLLDQSVAGFVDQIDNRNLNGGPYAEFQFMLNQFLKGFFGDIFEFFPRDVGHAELRWTITKIGLIIFRLILDVIAISWIAFFIASYDRPLFMIKTAFIGLPEVYHRPHLT